MLKSIRTSEENKEIISKLTRKLNLGSENIIARMALSYSLSKQQKLNLKDLRDSKGKEYSNNVLFGEHADFFIGMTAINYDLHISDRNIAKYIKLHIDDGLILLDKLFAKNDSGITGLIQHYI